MDHSARLKNLVATLERPLLVTSLVNIRYLTGFAGTSAAMVVSADGCKFVTDGRYAELAEDLVAPLPATEVVARGPVMSDTLAELVGGSGTVDVESDHVTWSFIRTLTAKADADLQPASGVVETLRSTKDAAEVGALTRAAAAGDAAFAALGDLVATAETEGDLGLGLIEVMRTAGGEAAGWPPIVAIGANAARPHHRSGEGIIGDGLLLLDYGCTVDGYHSDMTRTVWRGDGRDAEMDRIHAAVLASNEAGISAVGPGVKAHDVDETCRAVLREHGYEDYFVHSTGHGVGLEIHEAPWVKRNSKDVLEPGHVVTIEPGVYLPGRGGVRIEDMVLVTDSGGDVLTRSPKALRP